MDAGPFRSRNSQNFSLCLIMPDTMAMASSNMTSTICAFQTPRKSMLSFLRFVISTNIASV